MTITANDIQLYELLKQRLGNKEAEALVSFVDAKLKEADDRNLKTLATKEDLKDLELTLKEDIREVELKLPVKISETKTETIRWVFGLFIPLMLAILGLYIRK